MRTLNPTLFLVTGHIICYSMDLRLSLNGGHGNFIITLGLKKKYISRHIHIHGHVLEA